MPGRRLSHEDRRRIAAGLAEGLGYAEIARLLGRPTSTISREIARNGGPHAYRANRAHQAAAWRARRHKHNRPHERPAVADPAQRSAGAVREFEQQFVAMMVETGLPLMSARVLTCLFTSDAGSLTAAELVQRLRVSPASVSKGVRYVEGIGLLRRERDPGSRRERYVLDDDVWYRAWLSSSRSLTRWAATTEHGADVLGHATPAGARLDTTTRFFRFAVDALTQLAEHWRQTFAPETRPVAESRAEPPR